MNNVSIYLIFQPCNNFIHTEQVKLASCNTADCTQVSYQSVNALVAAYNAASISNANLIETQLVMASQDRPLVLFSDGTLKIGQYSTVLPYTVRTLDSNGTVGMFASLSLTQADEPVVSYFDVLNGHLMVSSCSQASCSASSHMRVDVSGIAGLFTSTQLRTVTTAGRVNGGVDQIPVIAYHDLALSALKLAQCRDRACSSASITTVDSNVASGKFTSLQIDSDNRVVIAYLGARSELRVAMCEDRNNKTVCVVRAMDATPAAYVSLQLNHANVPVIAYFDLVEENLKLAMCNDSVCSGPAQIRTVDELGNVGKHASLQLVDSRAVIAYQDASAGQLKLAMCEYANCVNASIRIVDPGPATGEFVSQATSLRQEPIISYYDRRSGTLKLALCDWDCSVVSITTLDGVNNATASNVGRFTSTSIDSRGNPVVSYYDVRHTNLKFTSSPARPFNNTVKFVQNLFEKRIYFCFVFGLFYFVLFCLFVCLFVVFLWLSLAVSAGSDI